MLTPKAFRMDEVKGPAQMICMVEEEDPQGFGYNYGAWRCVPFENPCVTWCPNYEGIKWLDAVAAWHNRAMNLSFCDGHMEYWHWEDSRTLGYVFQTTSSPPNPDLARLQQRACSFVRQKPCPVAAGCP